MSTVSDDDFATWKQKQLQEARRLRQDLDLQKRRLERLGVLFDSKNREAAQRHSLQDFSEISIASVDATSPGFNRADEVQPG